MTKDIFKAEKVTFFAIDQTLQALFRRVRGSKLTVKKID